MAGAPATHRGRNEGLSSSENELPDLKKPKLMEVGAGDELTDASMEEPPPRTMPLNPHPYTPIRQTRGARPPPQSGNWMDALQQIHSSRQELHTKADTTKDGQDRVCAEMIGLRSDMQQQEVRTAALEAVSPRTLELS